MFAVFLGAHPIATMRPSSTRPALLLRVVVLALGAAGAPAYAQTSTTVRVFVVWGSSNACGVGNEVLSRPTTPPPGTAYEYYWKGDERIPPLGPAFLNDPFPCHAGRTGEDTGIGSDKGSAWPQFARTYNTPLRHVLFMSSGAAGGTDVIPPPGDGAVILDMTRAR